MLRSMALCNICTLSCSVLCGSLSSLMSFILSEESEGHDVYKWCSVSGIVLQIVQFIFLVLNLFLWFVVPVILCISRYVICFCIGDVLCVSCSIGKMCLAVKGSSSLGMSKSMFGIDFLMRLSQKFKGFVCTKSSIWDS